ncbi:PREDICTED: kielin/chordin-like protein [Nicrophorus vespilloides]|uniref:Kielin/chordin-like protein n=1 Tax=Nicrophorus vespilloides TaxID=110193 RepID=A0ABM1NFA4_NICVS|nr:PREDICTED: kielin/chordin-like protein [Nicrophorus vespilloides]
MKMFKTIILILSITQYIQAECPEGCKDSNLLYEGLECKPIYEKPDDCCPMKYDCSHLEKLPEDQCYFRGKLFGNADKLPEETYENCNVGCRCRSGEVTCAILDCPEWLGVRPDPGCHLKYSLNKCCAAGEVCPPFEESSKCKVGNETYLEGQRFSPPDQPCTKCVCMEGFAGEFVEPFCKKSTCDTELRHIQDIRKNCAPAYYDKNDCCPYDFICPKNDTIISAAKPKGSSDLQCKYGSKLMGVGDKFERSEKESDTTTLEIKCECAMPPFVSCIKKYVYSS